MAEESHVTKKKAKKNRALSARSSPSAGASLEEGELLEHIYDIVRDLDSRQQTIEKQISRLLDTQGTVRNNDIGMPPHAGSEAARLLRQGSANIDGSENDHQKLKQSSGARKSMKKLEKAIQDDTDYGLLYVKISVQVRGESEWRCPEEMSESVRDSSSATVSSDQSVGRVKVHISHANGLQNWDAFGKSDPYCVCAITRGREVREHFRTRVVHDSLDPGWNEEQVIDVFKADEQIHFSVKDKDLHDYKYEKDPVLGSCSLQLDQVFPNGFHGSLQLGDASRDRIAIEDDNLETDRTEDPQLTKLLALLKAPPNKIRKRTTIHTVKAMSVAEKAAKLSAAMAIIIALNTICTGFSLDFDDYLVFIILDVLFLIAFIVEAVLKFRFYGWKEYFASGWNCFDFFVLVVDFVQLTFAFISRSTNSDKYFDVGLLRLIRSGRYLKLLRLMRLMRLGKVILMLTTYPILEDLVAMISGIAGGSPTLMWAIVLFIVVIYIASLGFRVLFGSDTYVLTCTDCADVDVQDYFKSVPRTMLTVFKFFFGDFNSVQGINLHEGIQSGYGGFIELFVCILFFVVFVGIFNVITAIFVERTLLAAKKLEERRMTERLNDPKLWAEKCELLIRKLYQRRQLNIRLSGVSTFKLGERAVLQELTTTHMCEDEFLDFVRDKEVRNALRALEIDECDHKDLFDILDNDNTGSLTLFEFVDGIRRLRGAPRRSDIISVDLMVREIQEQMHQTLQCCEFICQHMAREHASPSREASSQNLWNLLAKQVSMERPKPDDGARSSAGESG